MALGAGAQVSQEDKDKLKKKAEEKQGEEKRNLKGEADSRLQQAEGDDDDGANVGAIVGGSRLPPSWARSWRRNPGAATKPLKRR
jgi:hypothetical protein